jgi:hypothetical protein
MHGQTRGVDVTLIFLYKGVRVVHAVARMNGY